MLEAPTDLVGVPHRDWRVLKDLIQEHSDGEGYAIYKRSSKSAAPANPLVALTLPTAPQHIGLACTCSGKPPKSRDPEAVRRQSCTIKTNCPFYLSLDFNSHDCYYRLRIVRSDHNHLPLSTSLGSAALRRHAREKTPGFYEGVDLMRRAGTPARAIASTHRESNPTLSLTRKDLNNTMAKQKKEAAGGHSRLNVLKVCLGLPGEGRCNCLPRTEVLPLTS